MKKKLLYFSGFLFCCQLRSRYERRCLKTEHYRLCVPSLTRPYRILFLSDMHERSFGPGQSRLLRHIDALRPDLILVGGDMIISYKHRDGGRDKVEQSLVLLKALQRRYPVVYGMGNHEQRLADKAAAGDVRAQSLYDEFCGQLSQVCFLDNERLRFHELSLCGVSLPGTVYGRLFPHGKKPIDTAALASAIVERQAPRGWAERFGMAENDRTPGGSGAIPGMMTLGAAEAVPAFSIFLCHHPLYLAEMGVLGAGLVLSGHYHGGTIRLPFLGGVMTPQYQFFVPECAGWHKEGSCRMLVSRGMGTHSINIRLNNKPELTLLELQPTGRHSALGERQGLWS